MINHFDILKQRGIFKTAQEAGWDYHQLWKKHDGWSFPVYNSRGDKLGMRWKNVDSSLEPKYNWIDGKPEKARYYLLPDTIQAIKDARGFCYLASGEPDLLTYRSIGIRNVLCWFDGEGHIPDTFAEDMKSLGVWHLTDYPDRDKTGLKKAARLMSMLDGCEVKYIPRQLPGDVGSKNDINALWQSLRFDQDRLLSLLLDCEPYETTDLELYLTADDAPKDRTADLFSHQETGTDDLPDDFKRDLIADVERQPGFKRWGADGWSTNYLCPLSENHTNGDKSHSAGFNRVSMAFKCFVCGSMNAKQYGEKRGFILAEYFERSKPAKTQDIRQASQPVPPAPKIEVGETLEDYYTDSHDSMIEVERMFKGEIVSQRLARPFPYKTLHSFGGFAEIQEAGKLVYVTGVSGGSKTSFAECIVESDCKNGDDAMWYGPEWNDIEMRKRSIQRNGGLTFTEFSRYEMWLADKKRGVPPQDSMGRNITPEQYENTMRIIQQLKAWRGRVYQLKQHQDLDNMTSILTTMEKIVDAKRKAGRSVRSLFFDYIQRAPKIGRGEWDRLEMAVSSIKSLCERLDLFGYILVQPTKGDSKSAREGNDLTEASAQGLSDQQANLYLTLTPEFGMDGEKLPYIKVSVVKNSLGSTGKKYLKWAQRSLTIVDEEIEVAKTKHGSGVVDVPNREPKEQEPPF